MNRVIAAVGRAGVADAGDRGGDDAGGAAGQLAQGPDDAAHRHQPGQQLVPARGGQQLAGVHTREGATRW